MKNLFAIPRRSLFVVFTILITLVVCLAGFTEAEERQGGKQKIKKGENFLRKRLTREFFNPRGKPVSRNWQGEFRFNYPLKNSLSEFFEPDEYVREIDSDGYGYDDDEYYHFNNKRDHEGSNKLESSKDDSGIYAVLNKNENIVNQKPVNAKNDKGETETIELLSFKESHPKFDSMESQNTQSKPFGIENPAKKLPNTRAADILKVNDIKKNSAVDEKINVKKEESAGNPSTSDTKVASEKESKDTVKLKELKVAEESEKKEKEVSLKNSKESAVEKSLKDTVKNAEEKEKNVKLSESGKLDDNVKKETDTAKVTKEDKENPSCAEKMKTDSTAHSEVSQIKEGSNLVASDHIANAPKSKVSELEERNLGYEQFVGLTDYQDLRDRKEAIRAERPRNTEYAKATDRQFSRTPELGYPQSYLSGTDYFPPTYDTSQAKTTDYFNKVPAWNQRGGARDTPEEPNADMTAQQEDALQQQLMELKKLQQQVQRDSQQQRQPIFEPYYNFGDPANTEYQKNYLNFLKDYKGLDDFSAKVVPTELAVKNYAQAKNSLNLKKRSKTKRKSSDKEKVNEGNEKLEGEKNPKVSDTNPDSKSQKTARSCLSQECENTMTKESNKEVRNVPSEMENEVVNQNKQKNARFANPSFRLKKHLQDLTKLNAITEGKFRKALWKRTAPNGESVIKTRAVPVGYYTNRVQLGQKRSDYTEEKPYGGLHQYPTSPLIFSNEPGHFTNEANKNRLQPVWESKIPNYQHYTLKRHENGIAKEQSDDSLYLVRKDPNGLIPSFKTLSDLNKKKESESNTAPFLVFDQEDANNLQLASPTKVFYYSFGDLRTEGQNTNEQSLPGDKLKLARSPYQEKADKKYAYGFLQPDVKSGLKKGFEKFRDLADFFKDNEQESLESHHSAQELKEARNVVFSEDKMPDPILNNQLIGGFKLKPKNTMYSISKNFKQIDQDKKNDGTSGLCSNNALSTAECNSDNVEVLKNVFPEAKTVNTIQKNGNEIILLDFENHPLKQTHMPIPPQSQGSNYAFPNDRKVEVILANNEEETSNCAKPSKDKPFSSPENEKNPIRNANFVPQLIIPVNTLTQHLTDKSKSALFDNYQGIDQNDADLQQIKFYPSQNHEQTDSYARKRNLNYISNFLPSSTLAELSTYGNDNVKHLGSLIQNLMKNDKNALKPDKRYNEFYKHSDNEYSKQSQWYPSQALFEPQLPTNYQWNTVRDERNENQPLENEGKSLIFLQPAESELVSQILRLRREDLRKLRKTNKNDESNEHNENEENLDRGKSEFDIHLNELFENLKKNKKEQLYKVSGMNRRRRSHTTRQMRSPQSSGQNKVSTTEVQNKILSTLAEDNYQNVYSSGIKRKLLSIEHEAEDYDGYFEADGEDNNKVKGNNVTNQNKHSVNPFILQLFTPESDEKNRSRRSLNSEIHSNFKREIDLDESMPNDFQSFLETSLGGLGSQKREIIKKSDAYWDERGSYQDNANQIVENSPVGKSNGEDSPLEKREVSNSEGYNRQNHYKRGANLKNNKDVRSPKKIRSQEDQAKPNGYVEEKVPTKIRIQITNASSKEKKSSKSVMDESDTTSTEMDNPPPKEKEFLDKNKLNPLMSTQKLHQTPKSKFSHLGFREKEGLDSNGERMLVMRPPFRHGRRKKKKYIPEDAPKPGQDNWSLDKKAVESFLRKYLEDQTMTGNAMQKQPVSKHLPQVETVYNPTQGTNKAQVDGYKINKANELNSKSSVNDKNMLQSNEGFDNGMLRSHLREKSKMKDLQWKTLNDVSSKGQDTGTDMTVPMLQNLNVPRIKGSPSNIASSPSNHRFFNNLKVRKLQPPSADKYQYQFSAITQNDNSLQDKVKLQRDWENLMGMNKDQAPIKLDLKSPFKSDGSLIKQEEKDKPTNTFPPHLDDNWGNFETLMNKKSYLPKYKTKEYLMSSLKKHPEFREKPGFSSFRNNFLKGVHYNKGMQDFRATDPSKDVEYTDDEEYFDDDQGKDSTFDDQIMAEPVKGSRGYEANFFRNYKTPDFDNSNEYEDEPSEDYEETSDDDEVDDYSMLSVPSVVEPDVRSFRRNEKFNGDFRDEMYPQVMNPLYSQPEPIRFRDFEKAQFRNQKSPDSIEYQNFRGGITQKNIAGEPSLLSTNVLKKANENANIFGKNLMKNLYHYDDAWLDGSDQRLRSFHPRQNKLVKKRKFIRQFRETPYPVIGSRFFYAIKRNRGDDEEYLSSLRSQKMRRGNRYSHYSPERIPLDAEFSPENELECETEDENHFRSDIDVANGKKNDRRVQENLQGSNEIVNNVLENVVEKTSKAIRPNSKNGDENHSVRKRLVNDEEYLMDMPKVKTKKKRLTSGHLTESNFKKYHKKNANGKRKVSDVDEVDVKEKHTKRSPIGMWKKLKSKDRDDIKLEEDIVRNAGFEPLVAYGDQKEKQEKINEESAIQSQKKFKNDVQNQIEYQNKNQNLGQLKTNQPTNVKEQDGPWKIELSEKYDMQYFQPMYEEIPMTEMTPNWGKENLKAFFVLRNSERNERKDLPEIDQIQPEKELGIDYRIEEDGTRSKSIWKRSLERNRRRDQDDAIMPVRSESVENRMDGGKNMEQNSEAASDERSIRDSADFVNLEAQSQKFKGKFHSDLRSVSKKSIFPPPSDANILKDNILLNEETSERSGQEIIDAILSHASSDPKFKALIIPGLKKKTSEYRDVKSTRERDSSGGTQNNIEKIMLDLEKLAEKNVKTRMCNKIDPKSRKFLKTLVTNPSKKVDSENEAFMPHSGSCSLKEIFEGAESLEAQPQTDVENVDLEKCDKLKRRQGILTQMLEDHDILSGTEKDNYRQILQELENNNKILLSEKCKAVKTSASEPSRARISNNNNNNDSQKCPPPPPKTCYPAPLPPPPGVPPLPPSGPPPHIPPSIPPGLPTSIPPSHLPGPPPGHPPGHLPPSGPTSSPPGNPPNMPPGYPPSGPNGGSPGGPSTPHPCPCPCPCLNSAEIPSVCVRAWGDSSTAPECTLPCSSTKNPSSKPCNNQKSSYPKVLSTPKPYSGTKSPSSTKPSCPVICPCSCPCSSSSSPQKPNGSQPCPSSNGGSKMPCSQSPPCPKPLCSSKPSNPSPSGPSPCPPAPCPPAPCPPAPCPPPPSPPCPSPDIPCPEPEPESTQPCPEPETSTEPPEPCPEPTSSKSSKLLFFPPSCKPPHRPAFPPYCKIQILPYPNPTGKAIFFIPEKQGFPKGYQNIYNMPPGALSDQTGKNVYPPNSKDCPKGPLFLTPSSRPGKVSGQQTRRGPTVAQQLLYQQQNGMNYEGSKEELMRMPKKEEFQNQASVPTNYEQMGSGNMGPGNMGPGNMGPGNMGPENIGPGNLGPGNTGSGNSEPENIGQTGAGVEISDAASIMRNQLPDTTQGPLRSRQKVVPIKGGNGVPVNIESDNIAYPFSASKAHRQEKGESILSLFTRKHSGQKLSNPKSFSTMAGHRLETPFMPSNSIYSTISENLNYPNGVVLSKFDTPGALQHYLKENNAPFMFPKLPLTHKPDKKLYLKSLEQSPDPQMLPMNFDRKLPWQYIFTKSDLRKTPVKQKSETNLDKQQQNSKLNRQKRFFKMMKRHPEKRNQKFVREEEKKDRESEEIEEDPEEEYLAWSSVPGVQPNLNGFTLNVDALDRSSDKFRQVDKNP